MNRKRNIYGKWKPLLAVFFIATLLLIVACELTFKNLLILNDTGDPVEFVNAGDTVTFTFDMKIESHNNYNNEKIIIAVLAPRSWNARNNSVIKIKAPSSKLGDTWQDFEPVAVGTSPANMPGVEWPDALKIWLDDDPNIEDADMVWTAFISKNGTPVPGGSKWEDVKLKIKIKTGPDNVRCKVGFYAGNNSDALGLGFGPDFSRTEYNGWTYLPNCFEVKNGEGDLHDFCNLHYNSATPGSITQNDFITFRFNGGIDDDPEYFVNDLSDATEVYLNISAYTADNRKIDKKIKMTRMTEFGRSFSYTFWPEEFFELGSNESLSKFSYYFSNKDGSKYVDFLDDKIQSGAAPKPSLGKDQREIEPFNYTVMCR